MEVFSIYDKQTASTSLVGPAQLHSFLISHCDDGSLAQKEQLLKVIGPQIIAGRFLMTHHDTLLLY